MPARIRLARHGKKGRPFYHIVVADGRAPRDGRFIEKIGTYNPLTKPADIEIDIDKAVDWLVNGAQPTDTVRAILSYKGVLYKNHLLKGVKKGALTEEQAEEKFQAWMKEKEAKVNGTISANMNELQAEKKKRLEAEAKIKEERAAEISKRKAEEAGITEEAPASEEEALIEAEVETTEAPVAEETPAEEPKAEEAPVEETPEAVEVPKDEAPAEEVKEEAPEVAEEPKAEETPAEEEKKEE